MERLNLTLWQITYTESIISDPPDDTNPRDYQRTWSNDHTVNVVGGPDLLATANLFRNEELSRRWTDEETLHECRVKAITVREVKKVGHVDHIIFPAGITVRQGVATERVEDEEHLRKIAF